MIQKYDLSKLTPLIENDKYALYGLGYIREDLRKGIRYNKETKEQTDVIISTRPYIQVVSIIKNGIVHNLLTKVR